MAFMVRFCRRHLVAWAVTDGDVCPHQEDDGPECPVESGDAFTLIAELGQVVHAHEGIPGD